VASCHTRTTTPRTRCPCAARAGPRWCLDRGRPHPRRRTHVTSRVTTVATTWRR